MVDLSSLEVIGRVVGETTHTSVVFTATKPPRVGEYVIIEYPGNDAVLGIVEASRVGNPLLASKYLRPEVVEYAESFGAERHHYVLGQARLLSRLEPLIKYKVIEAPKYPPEPMARVFRASDDVLRLIFGSRGGGCVRLGVLANHPKVPFYVDIDAVVSRHLAILAVTGAGKSNTVAVLVRGIVDSLGGTVLLIDMHSEYGGVARRCNVVTPKINPANLTIYEYYRLLNLGEGATKQRLYLRRAYSYVKYLSGREREKFFELLIEEVERIVERGKYREVKGDEVREVKISSRDKSSVIDLLLKLYDLRDRYWGIVLSPEAPVDLEVVIKPGYANIIKLGSVGEEVADVITSHYLRRLLEERKRFRMLGKGYPVPVLTVIEEAHILIPKNRNTLTKEVVARVAREGRKFGLGLCLVSQRPKNIDEDALSQTNNKIILKLVEPQDQRYVQATSETLSDELLALLPSLNVGEAVILGLMTPIPALVKIDKGEKEAGEDVEAHKEWRKWVMKEIETTGSNIYDELGILP